MKIAKELENKLSNKENEVMELKKNEFKLREQINLLKKNNNEEKKRSDSINLKPKPSRFGACSISKKIDDTLENIEEENEGNENFNKKNFSRSQTFVPLKMDSSLKKGYTNTNKGNNNQNYSFIEVKIFIFFIIGYFI